MQTYADVQGISRLYAGSRVSHATESVLGSRGASAGLLPAPAKGLPPGPRSPGVVQTLRWMYRPTSFIESCWRRYGGMFTLRLGPGRNTVVVAEPAAAREVIRGDPSVFRAGDANGILKPVVGPGSLLLLDGEEHLHHRRIVLPAFSAEHGRAMTEAIQKITRDRVGRWQAGETLQLQAEMEAISLDAILALALGSGPEARNQQFRILIPEMMKRCSSPFTLLPYFRHELGGITPYAHLQDLLAELDVLFLDAIVERQTTPSDRDSDCLSLLCSATDEDGTPLSNRQIRDELLTMIMAGYETTTSALAWTFERLLRSPDVLGRLQEDLAGGREEYLDAVVKEVLRLRPVVPVVARKVTEDVELSGHLIPGGSVLMVSIYLLHRDPSLHEEPDEFRPERFLDGRGGEPWLPFGGGVRRCLGASFAQVEMKVVIREVLAMASLGASDPADEAVARRRLTFAPGRGARATVKEVSRPR
ncbi:MAG TPA: cytochrome P450 [Solirubrobacterales bacterium]|nr:cytochrome P450 [Solirubrobacterales bacterium]